MESIYLEEINQMHERLSAVLIAHNFQICVKSHLFLW